MKRNNLKIFGVVQGVGCRYFITRIARSMGIVGYTRNLSDGTVEVCAEAEEEALESFIGAIREGPSGGRVDRITVEEAPPTGEFSSFTVKF